MQCHWTEILTPRRLPHGTNEICGSGEGKMRWGILSSTCLHMLGGHSLGLESIISLWGYQRMCNGAVAACHFPLCTLSTGAKAFTHLRWSAPCCTEAPASFPLCGPRKVTSWEQNHHTNSIFIPSTFLSPSPSSISVALILSFYFIFDKANVFPVNWVLFAKKYGIVAVQGKEQNSEF